MIEVKIGLLIIHTKIILGSNNTCVLCNGIAYLEQVFHQNPFSKL